jgi:hypothetical protein
LIAVHASPVENGLPPGDHLVEHHAEGVDVGAAVHRGAGGLLGGHVLGCPDDGDVLGLDAARDHRLVELGGAEVQELHELGVLGAGGEEDVVGLEVPVDHAQGVDGGEGAGDLASDAHRPEHPQGAAPGEVGQGLAPEVLHHEEAGPVGAVDEVGDLHDVRVEDLVHGAGLGEEALHHHGVPGVFGAEDLQRHLPAQQDVLGQVDPAHAPLTENLLELVRPQHLAQVVGVGGPLRRGEQELRHLTRLGRPGGG